ncbi:MAG: hypothetical protein RMJ55_20285, partial [Roseiflexaceae bacterium]|nr:hypothetical protein [Roseiflexaceae bacterium]
EITAMGDANGNRLACGVWEDGMIVLDRLSNLEREWLVDVGEWRLSRSLKRIAAQAYATYRSPGGQRLRTTTAVREDVAQRFGYRSIAQIDAQTTSETTANALRTAELSRRVEAQSTARFTVRSVYQPLGERVPLWRVRPYDVLTIRNLPSISGLLRDPIRRVRVLAVEYDADRDRLTVEVEDPITMPAMIA